MDAAKPVQGNVGKYTSKENVVTTYDIWADTYDQHMVQVGYTSPQVTGEAIAKYLGNRYDACILDLAAGTGLMGEHLFKKGYKCIDALDASKNMLQKAAEKNVYRNLHHEYLTGQETSIPKDTYDVVGISAGLGAFHIPCDGLAEIIRITKPGGFVIQVARVQFLNDQKGNLEPTMAELETQGRWKLIERKAIPGYHEKLGVEGILTVFKVL